MILFIVSCFWACEEIDVLEKKLLCCDGEECVDEGGRVSEIGWECVEVGAEMLKKEMLVRLWHEHVFCFRAFLCSLLVLEVSL